MAWGNIDERRQYVAKILANGIKFNHRLKVEIGKMFGCSPAAIHADIVAIRTAGVTQTIHVNSSIKKKIFDRDGMVCQYCGSRDAYEYIIEHIVPAALGGPAKPYNLVVSCASCNSKKGRSVWLPANIDTITLHHPEWREKIISLAIPKID